MKPTPDDLAAALIDRFGFAIVPHMFGWEPQRRSEVVAMWGKEVDGNYIWVGRSTREEWLKQVAFMRQTWPDWEFFHCPSRARSGTLQKPSWLRFSC